MGEDGDDSPGPGDTEPTGASGEPQHDLDQPSSWERMDRLTDAETEGETDE